MRTINYTSNCFVLWLFACPQKCPVSSSQRWGVASFRYSLYRVQKLPFRDSCLSDTLKLERLHTDAKLHGWMRTSIGNMETSMEIGHIKIGLKNSFRAVWKVFLKDGRGSSPQGLKANDRSSGLLKAYLHLHYCRINYALQAGERKGNISAGHCIRIWKECIKIRKMF